MTFNKIMSTRIICTLLLGIVLNSFSAPRVERYRPVFLAEQGQFSFPCPALDCEKTITRNQREVAKRDMLHHCKGRHALPHDLTCAICNSKFTVIGSLHQHYKRHLNVKSHGCSYCTAKFLSVTELRRHGSSCAPRANIQSPWSVGNLEE